MQHFGIVLPVDQLHDPSLEVDRKSFVQPEVVPGGVRYQITRPGVGQFVGNKAGQGAVASQDGWGSRR